MVRLWLFEQPIYPVSSVLNFPSRTFGDVKTMSNINRCSTSTKKTQDEQPGLIAESCLTVFASARNEFRMKTLPVAHSVNIVKARTGSMRQVLSTGDVLQVRNAIVRLYPVFMIDVISSWPRSDKCRHYYPMNGQLLLLIVTPKIGVPVAACKKEFIQTMDRRFNSDAVGTTGDAANPSKVGHVIEAFKSNNGIRPVPSL